MLPAFTAFQCRFIAIVRRPVLKCKLSCTVVLRSRGSHDSKRCKRPLSKDAGDRLDVDT